jgi:predicted ABC-class ATPase
MQVLVRDFSRIYHFPNGRDNEFRLINGKGMLFGFRDNHFAPGRKLEQVLMASEVRSVAPTRLAAAKRTAVRDTPSRRFTKFYHSVFIM